MHSAPLVAETLQAWRDAERLLETLPPGSPDHETTRLLIAELRVLYTELTESHNATDVRLRASRSTIQQATHMLAMLAEKYGRALGGGGTEAAEGGPRTTPSTT